jgi:SAM-dependent methyltransferase
MNINRLAAQYRKPTGIHGFQVSKTMEERNAPAYDWLIPRLALRDGNKVLEIGYGTGSGLAALAAAHGRRHLYGIDFSRVMYRRARKKNRDAIKEGRVSLSYGDVIDYDRERDFDLIFCVNVVYFWNDLRAYLVKVSGLLKEGGTFQIFMASPERLAQVSHTHSNVFNKYDLESVTAELRRAGFQLEAGQTFATGMGPAYLVTARKPAG